MPSSLDIVITYFVSTLSVIAYNIPIAAAQEDNTNFLTYTNIDMVLQSSIHRIGLNDKNKIVNGHEVVSFTSADRVEVVFVQIQNATAVLIKKELLVLL
jgi:hypothetical protein